MTKNYRLELRLTREQKEKIFFLANAAGLRASEFVLFRALQGQLTLNLRGKQAKYNLFCKMMRNPYFYKTLRQEPYKAEYKLFKKCKPAILYMLNRGSLSPSKANDILISTFKQKYPIAARKLLKTDILQHAYIRTLLYYSGMSDPQITKIVYRVFKPDAFSVYALVISKILCYEKNWMKGKQRLELIQEQFKKAGLV